MHTQKARLGCKSGEKRLDNNHTTMIDNNHTTMRRVDIRQESGIFQRNFIREISKETSPEKYISCCWSFVHQQRRGCRAKDHVDDGGGGLRHPPPRPRECIIIQYSSIPVATCQKVIRSETDNQALKGGMGIVIEVLTIAQNSYVQTTTVVHIIHRK